MRDKIGVGDRDAEESEDGAGSNGSRYAGTETGFVLALKRSGVGVAAAASRISAKLLSGR